MLNSTSDRNSWLGLLYIYIRPTVLPACEDKSFCQDILGCALYANIKIVSMPWQGFVFQQLYWWSSKLFWLSVKPFESVSATKLIAAFFWAFQSYARVELPNFFFLLLFQLLAKQSIDWPSKCSFKSEPI